MSDVSSRRYEALCYGSRSRWVQGDLAFSWGSVLWKRALLTGVRLKWVTSWPTAQGGTWQVLGCGVTSKSRMRDIWTWTWAIQFAAGQTELLWNVLSPKSSRWFIISEWKTKWPSGTTIWYTSTPAPTKNAKGTWIESQTLSDLSRSLKAQGILCDPAYLWGSVPTGPGNCQLPSCRINPQRETGSRPQTDPREAD